MLILLYMFGSVGQWNQLALDFFYVGKFSITHSIFLSLLVFSDFLFLHDSVLIGHMLPEMYPFLLGYLICQHIIFLVVSYEPLNFCGISYNVPSFISDFNYLSLLSESS